MGYKMIINRARQFCEVNSFRFTQPRQRVLTLLAQRDKPLTAYQILESLSSPEEKLLPPTVYRAIDFWMTHRFIHRIESLKAYIICCNEERHADFCIFICDLCNAVRELKCANLSAQLLADVGNKILTITSAQSEVRGRCGDCTS